MISKRTFVALAALVGMSLSTLLPVPAPAASNAMTMYIFGGSQGLKGPDGNPHDKVVPADQVFKVGETYKITVINYDEGPHSITIPSLGIDQTIAGGKEQADHSVIPVSTTFTFSPKKVGNFRWYCKIPCDAKHGMWDMTNGFSGPGKEGYMAGFFVVIN